MRPFRRTETPTDESGEPELWLIQAATYLLGGHFTGFNVMGSLEDHAKLTDDAEISLILVAAQHAEVGAKIRELSKSVHTVLTVGAADVGEDLYKLIETIDPVRLVSGPAEPDDVAWLQYTGGTTGTPKGVMLSQRAMAQEVQSWLSSYGVPHYPRYLASAPITHAAVLAVLPTLVRGGTVILQQSFAPDTFLQAIEDHQVNLAFAVATMLYAVLDHADPSAYGMSSMETIVYGAAPVSPSRLAKLIEVFGPVFLQGYAQTESGGFLMSLRQHEHDPVGHPDLLSSCGRPAVGVVAAILDKHDEPVPDGEVGEICVRSPGVMRGYWNSPS